MPLCVDNLLLNLKGYSSYFGDTAPIEFFDPLTISQLRDEYLMINLRLIDGINLDIFKTNFNCKLEQYCQKTIDQMKGQGLIILQNNQLKLSTNGMLLTDEITLKLCTMLPD